MKLSIVLFAISFVLINTSLFSETITRESDSLALIELYNSTKGENWKNNENWLSTNPIEDWYGIEVELISQDDNSKLKVVREIDLMDNNLEGSIPNLNLPDIEELFLDINKLSGAIPKFDSPKLQYFTISHNQFTMAEIEAIYSHYIDLIWFSYDEQKITYNLNYIKNSNSVTLRADYTGQSEVKYSWRKDGFKMGETTNNTYDIVEENMTSTFKCLIYSTKINDFFYETNTIKFRPEILKPENDEENVALEFNANWESFPNVDGYYIQLKLKNTPLIDTTVTDNQFIDYKLNLLPNREYDFSVAIVDDNLKGLESSVTFSTLNINEYSNEKDSLELLKFFNTLTIPDEYFENSEYALIYDFDKPMYEWVAIETEVKNENGDLVHYVKGIDIPIVRIFSGHTGYSEVPISGELTKLDFPFLTHFAIDDHEFSGDIPANINDGLEYFSAVGNNFEGELPKLQMSNLRYLDLSKNNYTGDFDISGLPMLRNLNLSQNELSGDLNVFSSPQLESLDIRANKYQGSFSGMNSPNLISLYYSDNEITDFPDLNIHKNLYLISASNNPINSNLTDISKLENIQHLDLTNTGLKGSVPEFKSKHLENLHLSRNQLTGEVPTMENNQLTEFFLDHNKFTFKSFEDSYYKLKDLDSLVIHPQDTLFPLKQVNNGEDITFSIETDGFLDQYSWYLNDDVIPGSITNEITVTNPIGRIQCEIKNNDVEPLVLYSQAYIKNVQLIKPENNASDLTIPVEFEWEGIEDAGRYELTIFTGTPPFINPVVSLIFYDGRTTHMLSGDRLWYNQEFSWYISVFKDGKFAASSDTFKFSTRNVDVINSEQDSLELVKFYNHYNGENWKDNNWLTDAPLHRWDGLDFEEYLIDENTVERRLTGLYLSDLNLEGEFYSPDFNKLKGLALDRNKIRGELDFTNTAKIDFLNMNDNLITAGLESINQLETNSMSYIGLALNEIDEELPVFDEKQVETLHLYNNKIKGSVANLSNLKCVTIEAQNNLISGNIDDLIFNEWLYILNLNSNNIGGDIGNLEMNDRVMWIYLSDNNIGGEITNLDYANLQRITLSNNEISGNFTSELGPRLRDVVISGNKMRGKLADITESKISIFDISRNYFVFNDFRGQEWRFANMMSVNFHPQDTIVPIIVDKQDGIFKLEVNYNDEPRIFRWFRDGQVFDDSTNSKIIEVPAESGTYFCEVNSPIFTRFTLYSDTVNTTSTSIREPQSEFALYPNPAKDEIHLSLEYEKANQLSYEIFDYTGKLVQTGYLINGNTTIPVGDLRKGVYQIVLNTGFRNYRHRFIKE